jgi:hypothetical protein
LKTFVSNKSYHLCFEKKYHILFKYEGLPRYFFSQIASSIILWHDHSGTQIVLIHNIVQQATLTDKIYTTIKSNMYETLFLFG